MPFTITTASLNFWSLMVIPLPRINWFYRRHAIVLGVAVEIRVEYVQIQVRQRGSGGKSGGKGHGGHIGLNIGGKSGRGGIGIKVGGSGGRSNGKQQRGGKLRMAIGK